jgi:polysaccharide biosynthesis/export protein
MKSFFLLIFSLIGVSIFLLQITSCSTQKKIKYMQDLPDSGRLKNIPLAAYKPPVIQNDDILTILISTTDPQNTMVINAGNIPVPMGISSSPASSMSNIGGSGQQGSAGYLVNPDGFITLPIVGKIKLAGYTTTEATEIVRKAALDYYKDPTVIVRYANFKISVIGEVLKPGIYVIPNEKVSVLDAISLAGDLTIFAKRENILLLRENANGTETPYRINLKKSDLMSSPYFYLRQNDIIYVEPGTGKAAATDASQARYYTLVGSLLSVLIVLFTRN